MLLLPCLWIFLALMLSGLHADAWRLSILFLPGCALAWLAATRSSRLCSLLTHIWAFLFATDVTLRTFSWLTYQSDLDSTFILEALANTHSSEAGEYLLVHAHLLPLCLFGIFSLNLWFAWIRPRLGRQLRPASPLQKGSLACLILLVLVAYGLRPNRVHHPLNYWSSYAGKIQAYQSKLGNHQQVMNDWDQGIVDDEIAYEGPAAQTFVLVLAESVTRHNMQLCGYERPTTPQLAAMRAELTVFCSAYSPAASTLGALRMKLTDASHQLPEADRAGSLLARARQAGFKLFWISNQDDEYTASLFGRYSDVAVFTNRRSGRSSQSLDGALIDPFRAALADPHPRKFVVVHMIGAHPNYFLRYPPSFARFSERETDAVSRSLQSAGRHLMTRRHRNHYDNAILYHDHVLSEILSALKNSGMEGTPKTLLYASDHGNDVGHTGDHVGHSPKTEPGYAIPVMLWQSGKRRQFAIENHVILTDSLDINALRLMGVRWPAAEAADNWFSPNRPAFQPPDWPPWQLSSQH